MAVQFEPSVAQVPRSCLAALATLVLAIFLHAVFAFLNPLDPVEQAGGNTALAAQGSSFANMAAGIEVPHQTQEQISEQAAIPPPAKAPVQPSKLAAVVPFQPVPVDPILAETATRVQAVSGGVPLFATRTDDPTRLVAMPRLLPQAHLEEMASAPPKMRMVPVAPKEVGAVAPTAETTVKLAQDTGPTEAPKPEMLQPEALQSEPQPPVPQSPSVAQSLRPDERPVRSEPVRRAEAKPVAQPSPNPRGNGEVSATRGVASSTRSQPGGQAQTTGGKTKVQGTAAASTYGGLVMRRIQRAKRRADVRGVALVRFSIGAGGGLTAVSLARSSGSGKLDGIALAQVRRAAPFPPPPTGARTSFTVRIKGN